MTTTVTKSANNRGRPDEQPALGVGLTVERAFSIEGVHPYGEVIQQSRDVVQTNWKTGEVIFEQRGVELPDFWSVNASTIVTNKYFRGALGTPRREADLKTLIDRVVRQYVRAGRDNGYFATDRDAEIFGEELTWLLLHRCFSFNSPVWFNVGTHSSQQVSACFILSVDDSMESILNWYKEEGFIFRGGSGAGLNLSRIRSSKELLNSSGTASGPVSFIRDADASAGTIKSGGAIRRTAKMVALDVDRPDIEEFVEIKACEKDEIRALRDAGLDMDLGGKDITSVQYQNANNSVRVTDEFMSAVEAGTEFGLRARTTGEVIEKVDVRELFHKIAKAAWECAGPGVQYHDTANVWHTAPESGPIVAPDPYSEYMSLDNSSCNLASLNLLKFLGEDGVFDVETFMRVVELIITAMDTSICFADFPTGTIGEATHNFRQLGIGYANLGALLMAMGKGYDTGGGHSITAAITSIMTATSCRRSAGPTGIVGPYNGYARNVEAHKKVMRKHRAANDSALVMPADKDLHAVATWKQEQVVSIGEENSYRNAQASVPAPIRTIGFTMDCDTTGVEPDFSLVKFRKFVGGGSMQTVNQAIPRALTKLGYDDEQVRRIVDFISENGHVVGAPGLAREHYEVFDTAMGQWAITPMGHVRVMAAMRPFLSGATSKTANLPEFTTVEDIADVYRQGQKLGLKALVVYRDNCKVGQPLSDGKKAKDEENVKVVEKMVEKVVYRSKRERLPKSRQGRTTSFSVSGVEGYTTSGTYEDGRLGEVFLKLGRQGSTLAGMMDVFSIAMSIGLQYGVPFESFVQKFTNLKFESAGMIDDPDIRIAQSLVDYIFRRLTLDYLSFDDRADLGIYTAVERARYIETGPYLSEEEEAEMPEAESLRNDAYDDFNVDGARQPSLIDTHITAEPMESMAGRAVDAPLCMTCGTKMRPSGSCYVCGGRGSTNGCS